jgi:hypothetical protein
MSLPHWLKQDTLGRPPTERFKRQAKAFIEKYELEGYVNIEHTRIAPANSSCRSFAFEVHPKPEEIDGTTGRTLQSISSPNIKMPCEPSL